MRPGSRHIATRFALLLALAGVLPLIAYGAASILSLRRGTRQSVVQGNANVAARAVEEIRRYITTNAELLKALAANLQDTGLTQDQQDRIIKNYVLDIRQFREITLFDESGAMLATSRIGKPRVEIPNNAPLLIEGVVDVGHPSRRRPAAHRRCSPSTSPGSARRPAGSSASSASRKCGGRSIASRLAPTATPWCSRRTASWSRTAIPIGRRWSRSRQT